MSPLAGKNTAAPRVLLAPDSAPRDLAGIVDEACRIAQARLGVKYPGEIIRVQYCTGLRELQEYIGSAPTEIIAIARAEEGEIVVNGEAYGALERSERMRSFVHEMVHLIIGRCPGGAIPAWLNEGLAMVAADETDRADNFQMTLAGTFGGLRPLAELEREVLFGGEDQRLAYAKAYSVTRFLLARHNATLGAAPDDPAPLARELADPARGQYVAQTFWIKSWRDALEIQWAAQHKDVWQWIMALTGGSALWTMTTLMFLLAYWRKRRFAQQKMERFERDEARDKELGLDYAPSDYGADWDADEEDEEWDDILDDDGEDWKR